MQRRTCTSKFAQRAATLLILIPLSPTAFGAQTVVRHAPREQRPRIHFTWINPTTWPVVPVPNISVNPTNGATLGIIPTWLQHGSHGEFVRILAPDVIHNANFGWGGHFRLLDYPSVDTQWSIVAGAMQRVESNLDALYETGLLRENRWSLTVEARYDRNGTARFFGIGNASPHADQSIYTDQQLSAQSTVGWNITHAWQLAYTVLVKEVKVISGHLAGIASITSRFAHVQGLGTTHEILQRISLVYDTRDSIRLPRSGVNIVIYGGIASRNGSLESSLYTETGIDARSYWSPDASLTIATHVDLRYMPSVNAAPFWALSSIGGEHSILGGRQTLRGYGDSRFYGRDSFSANIEFRQKLLTIDTLGTRIELQTRPSTTPVACLSTSRHFRSTSCTMSSGSDWGASRLPSWSATSMSVSAVKVRPCSPGSIIRFDRGGVGRRHIDARVRRDTCVVAHDPPQCGDLQSRPCDACQSAVLYSAFGCLVSFAEGRAVSRNFPHQRLRRGANLQ